MNDNEGRNVIILNENGEEVVCDIIFEFDSSETNKHYVAYTNYEKDDKGNFQVFASCCDPNIENAPLEPIQTEAEWNTVEQMLNTLQTRVFEELKNRMGTADNNNNTDNNNEQQ